MESERPNDFAEQLKAGETRSRRGGSRNMLMPL